VIAVHQHFRLDHRHQALFLAQGSIAGERMGVGFDAGARGDVIANMDHRPPFGKTRTKFVILLQARTQTIEPFGHHLTGKPGQRMGALIDLDPGDDAVFTHVLRKGHAIAGGLANGFIEQDRAGNMRAEIGRGQQQFPIGAAVFLGIVDPHTGKTLGNGGGGFVNGDNTLARCHHGLGRLGELFDTHGSALLRSFGQNLRV